MLAHDNYKVLREINPVLVGFLTGHENWKKLKIDAHAEIIYYAAIILTDLEV